MLWTIGSVDAAGHGTSSLLAADGAVLEEARARGLERPRRAALGRAAAIAALGGGLTFAASHRARGMGAARADYRAEDNRARGGRGRGGEHELGRSEEEGEHRGERSSVAATP